MSLPWRPLLLVLVPLLLLGVLHSAADSRMGSSDDDDDDGKGREKEEEDSGEGDRHDDDDDDDDACVHRTPEAAAMMAL